MPGLLADWAVAASRKQAPTLAPVKPKLGQKAPFSWEI
jgi:hypothetical protein